jgi:hypothetical protein
MLIQLALVPVEAFDGLFFNIHLLLGHIYRCHGGTINENHPHCKNEVGGKLLADLFGSFRLSPEHRRTASKS